MNTILNIILVALKTRTKEIEMVCKEGDKFSLNLEPNIKKLFVKGSLKTSKQIENECAKEAVKIYEQLQDLKLY